MISAALRMRGQQRRRGTVRTVVGSDERPCRVVVVAAAARTVHHFRNELQPPEDDDATSNRWSVGQIALLVPSPTAAASRCPYMHIGSVAERKCVMSGGTFYTCPVVFNNRVRHSGPFHPSPSGNVGRVIRTHFNHKYSLLCK